MSNGYILYDSIYVTVLNWLNLRDGEQGAGCGGGGGGGDKVESWQAAAIRGSRRARVARLILHLDREGRGTYTWYSHTCTG